MKEFIKQVIIACVLSHRKSDSTIDNFRASKAADDIISTLQTTNVNLLKLLSDLESCLDTNMDIHGIKLYNQVREHITKRSKEHERII